MEKLLEEKLVFDLSAEENDIYCGKNWAVI